ncbi:MAG: hypothetical protein JO257_00480, partial [Deltaproteobacteria bacterium]|nr:hypothetical protein [Deltaproteobacteria bacterium]
GRDAALYVAGGQFRPGDFPAATGGPAAVSLQSLYPAIVIGQDRQQLTAALEPTAQAAIVGIVGEPGTWIVVAGPPDLDTPGLATMHATVGVDRIDPGMVTFEVAGVDAHSRIGEPATLDVVAADSPPPDGDLVVTLNWLGAADLDLHVVDPLGGEAWSGSPNTWQKPPPGLPPDPNAFLTGGILDQDGNAGCTRDGAPHEDVVWKTRTSSSGMMVMPIIPSGAYTVRVDARSMCGDASEAWAVTVYSHGEVLAQARGIATPSDVTYEPHGAGAGITALHFQL